MIKPHLQHHKSYYHNKLSQHISIKVHQRYYTVIMKTLRLSQVVTDDITLILPHCTSSQHTAVITNNPLMIVSYSHCNNMHYDNKILLHIISHLHLNNTFAPVHGKSEGARVYTGRCYESQKEIAHFVCEGAVGKPAN